MGSRKMLIDNVLINRRTVRLALCAHATVGKVLKTGPVGS